MSKITVLFILILATVAGCAQSVRTPSDHPAAQIKTYAVLPDRGYTLDKVRADTTLHFITGDSLRMTSANRFWIKIVVVNSSHYNEPYNLYLQPSLKNTLYVFDTNNQRWVSQQTGIYVPDDKHRRGSYREAMPFVAEKRAETTLYVKADLHLLHRAIAIKPQITIESQTITDNNEQFILVTWIATLAILCLFFLNNLFIYFSFKDKIVLYYLIGQIGAMIYITYYKRFIEAILPCPVFTFDVWANGDMYYFDLTDVLQHFSIVLILYWLVQSTRTYLNTATTLPRLDFMLKYGLYAYAFITVILVAINSWLFYLEPYTLGYHNMLALILIGTSTWTCIIGYLRKLPAATPFLLANMLPLLFMLAIVLSHLVMILNNTAIFDKESILPDLSIISQTLSFSIALVARTKYIQRELATRKIEAQKLEFNIREMELRHQLTELENQKISADIQHEKTRNELLQEKLDVNQRELASTTLYLVQKNEMLAGLKAQLLKLNKQYPNVRQQGLKSIESLLQSNLYLDADWGKFKVHFEQVHPDFFENLLAKHPNLTKYEIRLYAYFHINLSTKEIAALLNIDPASVRRAKTRLYKKMAIPEPDVLANPNDQ
ncbi:hypothetical protein GCM10028818_24310 [Spirosoma horti]